MQLYTISGSKTVSNRPTKISNGTLKQNVWQRINQVIMWDVLFFSLCWFNINWNALFKGPILFPSTNKIGFLVLFVTLTEQLSCPFKTFLKILISLFLNDPQYTSNFRKSVFKFLAFVETDLLFVTTLSPILSGSLRLSKMKYWYRNMICMEQKGPKWLTWKWKVTQFGIYDRLYHFSAKKR